MAAWETSKQLLKARDRQDLETLKVPAQLLDAFDASGQVPPTMLGTYGLAFSQWYATIPSDQVEGEF